MRNIILRSLSLSCHAIALCAAAYMLYFGSDYPDVAGAQLISAHASALLAIAAIIRGRMPRNTKRARGPIDYAICAIVAGAFFGTLGTTGAYDQIGGFMPRLIYCDVALLYVQHAATLLIPAGFLLPTPATRLAPRGA